MVPFPIAFVGKILYFFSTMLVFPRHYPYCFNNLFKHLPLTCGFTNALPLGISVWHNNTFSHLNCLFILSFQFDLSSLALSIGVDELFSSIMSTSIVDLFFPIMSTYTYVACWPYLLTCFLIPCRLFFLFHVDFTCQLVLLCHIDFTCRLILLAHVNFPCQLHNICHFNTFCWFSFHHA